MPTRRKEVNSSDSSESLIQCWCVISFAVIRRTLILVKFRLTNDANH